MTADRDEYILRAVGWVESTLVDPATAPKQGDEGAPEAWIDLEPSVLDAVRDLQAGTDVLVLTWLHRARRDVVTVHPRDDRARPQVGVFSTRSADRPNPIGLHRVTVVAAGAGARFKPSLIGRRRCRAPRGQGSPTWNPADRRLDTVAPREVACAPSHVCRGRVSGCFVS